VCNVGDCWHPRSPYIYQRVIVFSNLNSFILVSLHIVRARRQEAHPHAVCPIVKVNSNGGCPRAVAVDVGHRAFVPSLPITNDADVGALLEVGVSLHSRQRYTYSRGTRTRHGLCIAALTDEPHPRDGGRDRAAEAAEVCAELLKEFVEEAAKEFVEQRIENYRPP
jgi:hypothetical protein